MKAFSSDDSAVIETSANSHLSFIKMTTLIVTGNQQTGDSSDDGDKDDNF